MDPAACSGPHPAAPPVHPPMRVLHFRSTFTFAGPERILLTLGGPLRALGVETKIIAYYRWRPPEPTSHWLVEQGRREHLDVEQWDDRSRFSWRTVRRLAEELKQGGYDLLVTHDHKTDLMGYLAAQRAQIPCLAVAHGYDFSLLRMRLYRRVDLMVLRRFPCIVAVSDSLRGELIAAGLSPDRIRVVPTAIDIARFSEGAVDRADEWRRLAGPRVPVVLTVGRLYRQKGLEYFVQAAAQVHKVVPQARFWIVGAGMRRRPLEAQIRALGLEGVVALLGQQRDIAAIMAACDVFALPSLGEGLSNVLLEAMALAKPVVATRVGGTPEIVREGETGWLVPPRQSAALAAAILTALRDPALAARIGAQGRDLVARRFGASHVAARMADEYRHAAAPRGPQGDERTTPHAVAGARSRARGRLGRWLRLGLRAVLHVLCLPFRPSAPRVLLWHSLDQSGGHIAVTPELFARQIAWLARQGYEAWPASRYVEALVTKAALPPRLVVLTFDDGYSNILDQALPALRAQSFSATVFLVTGAVGQPAGWTTSPSLASYGRILTWSEAQLAARDGLEFESHTHSHPFLDRQPDERVREELAKSRVELESRGLGRGRVIAWPNGAYETRVGALALREGYAAGFLDEFRWSLRQNPDLFRLNRIPMNPDLGVFGVAFSLGKGVEVWSWLRERLGIVTSRPG
jgi:glycosyltransferase involved in cell wall biosynthesis/peptidoglycan/xylan/chitin deacetylase (PgdA/CDA1 family)